MFIDKILGLAVGILFLVVLSCDGPTMEENSLPGTAKAPATLYHNAAFCDYAASSNLLQIELGQLAMERGGTDTLKARAERAVKFHSSALQKLRGLVKERRTIHLPDSLTGADRDLVEEFKMLESEEFNSRYEAFLVSSHQTQLARYQEALQKADEQELREWLKSLEMHIQNELKAETTTDSLL